MLLQYAFVDPLSAMMDPSLSLTVHERDEWGDPLADAAAHALLQAISPYHRILKGNLPACPVLLLNSAIDVRVQPWQQPKYVKALRSALKNDRRLAPSPAFGVPPVLMITDFYNGHMGPDDSMQQADVSARNIAWMLAAVGEI
jgi:oligopeptidase B